MDKSSRKRRCRQQRPDQQAQAQHQIRGVRLGHEVARGQPGEKGLDRTERAQRVGRGGDRTALFAQTVADAGHDDEGRKSQLADPTCDLGPVRAASDVASRWGGCSHPVIPPVIRYR